MNASPVARRTSSAAVYPFSAIVGQERMKLALILNVIDPGIGGILIRGEKGTAKSTAVRALTSLMPGIAVFSGCVFACDPSRPDEWCPKCRERKALPAVFHRRMRVVTLPLNATEDMVVGGHRFCRDGCVWDAVLSSRAFWHGPIVVSSTSMRSTCWTITWSISFWMRRPPVKPSWSGRESLSAMPPASPWSAP